MEGSQIGDGGESIESLRAENAELRRLTKELTAALECPAVDVLSARERQIFKAIGDGMTTGDIGEQLHVSPSTVETYRDRIKTKLKLKSGAQLVRFAVMYSLVNARQE